MAITMIAAITFLCALSSAVAFNTAARPAALTSITLGAAKSKSVPFADQPKALDGTLAGDVGFDPLGLSNIFPDRDWRDQIVPDKWMDPGTSVPIRTVDWMVDAEIKHGRMCMLAVLGWVAVDAGLRFPGEMFAAIPNSLAAHDAAVANGSMGFLLFAVSLLELTSGAAILDQARGSGRAPGEFNFDPLGFGKNAANLKRYRVNEVKNGRLAMLAFSGIVTQAALFPEKAFPFF